LHLKRMALRELWGMKGRTIAVILLISVSGMAYISATQLTYMREYSYRRMGEDLVRADLLVPVDHS